MSTAETTPMLLRGEDGLCNTLLTLPERKYTMGARIPLQLKIKVAVIAYRMLKDHCKKHCGGREMSQDFVREVFDKKLSCEECHNIPSKYANLLRVFCSQGSIVSNEMLDRFFAHEKEILKCKKNLFQDQY